MDIREMLGDKYKEDMTAGELLSAIEELELVSAEETRNTVDKSTFDKTASELSKLKKELNALKTASMTDTEKLQQELDKATETQTKYAQELSKLRAKEIFVTAGLAESDYESLLEFVVSDDEEITKANATKLVDLVSTQKTAAEKAVRAELIKNTPTPPAGSSGGVVGNNFEEEIEAARASGDMAQVASLIRQQASQEQSQI